MKVSIIIVTLNRKDLLFKCLDSLREQITTIDSVEVIVVDNGSTDETIVFLDNFTASNRSFRYFVENKIGASYARNTGISNSISEWVCFLDDDGIPASDFVKKLIYTIDNYQFDGFGGMWYPYADKPIPIWLPIEVTTMRLLSKTIRPLSKGTTVAAGICAFKRDIVIKCGCFPVKIGPRNGKMGYGEEDYLQLKIWDEGKVIGFNPYWSMTHIVADYKFSLKWNLNRFYLKGRDSNSYLPVITPVKKIKIGLRILIVPLYLLLANFPKMIMDKNYVWQNWVLDSFKYSFRMFGRLISKT